MVKWNQKTFLTHLSIFTKNVEPSFTMYKPLLLTLTLTVKVPAAVVKQFFNHTNLISS